MRRSSLILTLVCFGLAAAVIAWAALWPVDVPRPDSSPAANQDPNSVARVTEDPGKSEVWKMRWQSWQNKKAVVVQQPKPAPPPVKPVTPPPPVVEKPPGVTYQGAIFENDYAFGFFNTPAGPKYAAVGQVVKFGSDTMKIVAIETGASIVEFQGRTVRLDLDRKDNRMGPMLRPAGAPPVPPPSMNKPDMTRPIILDRAKM